MLEISSEAECQEMKLELERFKQELSLDIILEKKDIKPQSAVDRELEELKDILRKSIQ